MSHPLSLPPVEPVITHLPNGLTLLVEEDHSAPVASVQVWVETGSIHEGEHLGAGMSHLLEHLMFKGTERRGPNEFAQSIQDHGGYLNAYTSFDRTVYWVDVPAKGVSSSLDLLLDAVFFSTLPAGEYAKEQEVIRREFAMGYDDPDRMSSVAMFATAYRAHPFRHPVIGHQEIFDALSREQVLQYYRTRYIPNNTFVVVAGAVNADEVLEVVSRCTSKIGRRSLVHPHITPEPGQLGRRESHTEFPTDLTRLGFSWHCPPLQHADAPALDVLAVALGGGRSSRLYQTLREQKRLVHGIDAWCWTPSQPGLFGIDAVLDAPNRAAVSQEIEALVHDVQQGGITEAELSKARRAALRSQLEQLTTMRGKASDLGGNWLLARDANFSHTYLQHLQTVTVEDVGRVARTYLKHGNSTIVSLNPKGALASKNRVHRGPTAGEIQRFELSNGLRLLVREDPRLPLISTVATFKAGLLAETETNNGITKLLARVLLKGTNTRTAEDIAHTLESLGGSIGTDGGNNSISASVRVMRPDLEIGVNLLADVLLNATLPARAIDREREVQLASIRAEEEEMTSIARNLMRKNLFAGHPLSLRALGSPESVNSLTREDLQAFMQRHLVGSNGVIAVFGDVHAEEVRALIEKEFSGMASGEPALTAPAQPIPLMQPVAVSESRDKTQAVIMAGYHGVSVFDPDRTALEVIDEACSDLGSRFFIRIREEMGLAYFVGSSMMPGLVRGAFAFYAGTDPNRVDEVEKALMQEIASLAEHGLSEIELARAKAKLLGQMDIRYQSNEAFAFSCALDELYGLGYMHYLTHRQEIENMEMSVVRDAARRVFGSQFPVIAVVRGTATGVKSEE